MFSTVSSLRNDILEHLRFMDEGDAKSAGEGSDATMA